jgi:hypothetical protein
LNCIAQGSQGKNNIVAIKGSFTKNVIRFMYINDYLKNGCNSESNTLVLAYLGQHNTTIALPKVAKAKATVSLSKAVFQKMS